MNIGPLALSPNLVVTNIDIKNIIPAGPNKFFADLIVKFDPSKLVRAFKPISLKLTLLVDPTNKILGCSSDKYTSSSCVTKSAPFQPTPGAYGSGIGDISCDPGFRAVSGGGTCHNGGGHYLMVESKPISTDSWHVECCGYNQGTGHMNCNIGNGTIYVVCCP